MSNGHGAVAIFELTADELREMMIEHVNNAVENLRKCEAYLSTFNEQEAERSFGVGVRAARATVETIMRGIRNRIVETGWYIDHLRAGPFPMSGAELVGFKQAFAPFDLNVERAILSVQDSPAPNGQAERARGSTIVQIPRLSFPDGVIG